MNTLATNTPTSPKKGKRGLDAQIVKLHLEGHSVPTIAGLVKCSKQNVSKVLARRGFAGKLGWGRHIARLSTEHVAFLERDAARNNCGIPEIISGILVDAIEELIAEEAELACLGDNTGALNRAPVKTGSPRTPKTSLV